ncbi:hypothetical protein RHMOL_Rhmol04G0139200 [Rhododendron molle]|uniref:Uncharacterized protein n=1 Tax=Rhododendron molle TaxID=49168 RepID=A0ACC0P2C0_RHOML|nr:hypothetical protein RHMOL_Rhmol04G0139200 [Rhododendron molle]
MFTGKRPTDNIFSDGLSLHNFAKVDLPAQIPSIVDPILFQQREKDASTSINNAHNQSSDSNHKILECLISILKLGVTCSEELPSDRLAINVVVPQLQVIKNTLLGGRRTSIAVSS